MNTNLKAAAKAIKAELKAAGIKASVRSECYGMGNAIRITVSEEHAVAARAVAARYADAANYLPVYTA